MWSIVSKINSKFAFAQIFSGPSCCVENKIKCVFVSFSSTYESYSLLCVEQYQKKHIAAILTASPKNYNVKRRIVHHIPEKFLYFILCTCFLQLKYHQERRMSCFLSYSVIFLTISTHSLNAQVLKVGRFIILLN